MKDLKHLFTLERLLDDVDNELVRKAQEDGRKCIGNICFQTPEVLMDLPGTFTIRLRAPRSGSMDMATYYMTSFLCEFSRAILERAIEGGFECLDALVAPDGCTMINRCVENMELLNTMPKENFYYQYLEVPMKDDDNGLNLYVSECRKKILQPLHDTFGIDISDDALRTAVENYNKVCRVINEIGDYRKEDNPRITGYEFHLITMASHVCPKDLLLPILEETLEELKTREPDEKPPYRARVAVVGSEIDDIDMIKLIEESGALVVADRYCYGSLPGREEIVVANGDTPLRAIARHYLKTSQCARFMPQDIMRERKQYLVDTAKEYGADGIIVAQNKFCAYWSYERTIDTIVIPRDYGIPVCSIEKEYINGASGQLRTRFQAFVESVELKKIQEGA